MHHQASQIGTKGSVSHGTGTLDMFSRRSFESIFRVVGFCSGGLARADEHQRITHCNKTVCGEANAAFLYKFVHFTEDECKGRISHDLLISAESAEKEQTPCARLACVTGTGAAHSLSFFSVL